MNAHKQGWFTETAPTSNDETLAVSIRSTKVILEETTDLQKITVFESDTFGKCLALDDVIQCTEFDRFSHREMIAFVALNSHPRPSRVLVIGGGDGGVSRECLKHPMVNRVFQCGIDKRVVEIVKQHFPSMDAFYYNPKLELKVGDSFKYVSEMPEEAYDVIITDLTNPRGPGEKLSGSSYYEMLKRKLTKDGVCCCMAGSIWVDLDSIMNLMEINRTVFPQVQYSSAFSCTYPSGQIGFLVCSKSRTYRLGVPVCSSGMALDERKLNLKYYCKTIHEASFVLPQFVQRKLYGSPRDHEPQEGGGKATVSC